MSYHFEEHVLEVHFWNSFLEAFILVGFPLLVAWGGYVGGGGGIGAEEEGVGWLVGWLVGCKTRLWRPAVLPRRGPRPADLCHIHGIWGGTLFLPPDHRDSASAGWRSLCAWCGVCLSVGPQWRSQSTLIHTVALSEHSHPYAMQALAVPALGIASSQWRSQSTTLSCMHRTSTSSASFGHCIVTVAVSKHYTLIRAQCRRQQRHPWALPNHSGALKALHSHPCATQAPVLWELHRHNGAPEHYILMHAQCRRQQRHPWALPHHNGALRGLHSHPCAMQAPAAPPLATASSQWHSPSTTLRSMRHASASSASSRQCPVKVEFSKHYTLICASCTRQQCLLWARPRHCAPSLHRHRTAPPHMSPTHPHTASRSNTPRDANNPSHRATPPKHSRLASVAGGTRPAHKAPPAAP